MIINKNNLITKLLILFLCFFSKSYSQYTMIHQNDSIYKVNKIKSIKYYSNNHFSATILCDKEGRWIEIIHEPFSSGRQITEYFEYDENGKLIKQFEKIQNKDIKIINIEIESSNNELIKLTRYNASGKLEKVEHFKNKGRKKIIDYYINGHIIQEITIEYLDDFNEKKNYGWNISPPPPNSKRNKWVETFEYKFKNGLVEQYTIYRNGKKRETVHHLYNADKLIEKVIYYNVTQQYEYERYE
jgi:antitoxin component YwqK of YwqJK toxin-antitoxin module